MAVCQARLSHSLRPMPRGLQGSYYITLHYMILCSTLFHSMLFCSIAFYSVYSVLFYSMLNSVLLYYTLACCRAKTMKSGAAQSCSHGLVV